MDEYYNKYARPLGKLNIFEVKQNLSNWRDGLREELECLIYLRNGLNNDNFNKVEFKVKNKLLDIINKLENISLKEIECISEFAYELDKSAIHEVDDKIFTKLEFIRDNFNKILLNIQKMISSSPILLEMREKFDRNQSSLIQVLREKEKFEKKIDDEIINKNKSDNFDKPRSNKNEKSKINTNNDWLDKLNNDVESLNKETNNKRKSRTNSLNYKKDENDYTVDKDLDKIIENFQKSVVQKKYKSTEKINQSKTQKISSNNLKNTKDKIRNVTPPEKSNTLNTINNTNTVLPTRSNTSRVTYESIKNISDEIDHIKRFCQDLKKSQEENCIMENEKKVFDKMKNEHIKLHADMSILKEDIKEILSNYQQVTKRISILEEENKNLRQHNKNLVKFINNSNYPLQMEEENNYNRNMGTYNRNNINLEYSTPLSELSAFNTNNNNLSSVEMINNINQNSERNKKLRFLIPKQEQSNFNNY